MTIKGLVDEDFVNYKLPSMFISTPTCSFKCEKESEVCCCQNSNLAKQESRFVDDAIIIKRYLNNDITKAIVFGGLEPFDNFEELYNFIRVLRQKYHCDDSVVIYTGYNKKEILFMLEMLKPLKSIIVKYGRFIPNQEKKYDEILGVYLASPNQYAEELC